MNNGYFELADTILPLIFENREKQFSDVGIRILIKGIDPRLLRKLLSDLETNGIISLSPSTTTVGNKIKLTTLGLTIAPQRGLYKQFISNLNDKVVEQPNSIKEPLPIENYQINVERLKNLMTSAATDLAIEIGHETEYSTLRQSLLKEAKFKKLAPKFIMTCSTLKEFKREMQVVSKEYSGRRSHIKNLFNPILNSFFATETVEEAIADIVQQVDFGQLTLLPQDIQEKGKEMSDVYLYLYCIENSLRIFISEISKRETVSFPAKVLETVTKMKESEKESKYLPVRGDSDLFYCDFIQLGKIIVANWPIFKKYFPEQNEHWLNVMIGELYKIRCLVAHNSFVGEHERQSLKVYYKNIISQLKM